MTDNVDSIVEPDDESEVEVSDLYKRLLKDECLVITCYKQDLPHIRKTLSTIKFRDSAKMRDSGLEPDNRKLEFAINDETKTPNGTTIKLRIELKEPAKVRIIGDIITLDGDLI